MWTWHRCAGAELVVLSDVTSVVQSALRPNVNLNAAENARATPLHWGRSSWKGFPCGVEEWDYIIASDCIYTKSTQIVLTYTIKQLMPPGGSTSLILSYVRRSSMCDAFAPRLEEEGFRVQKLAPEHIHDILGVQSNVFILIVNRL